MLSLVWECELSMFDDVYVRFWWVSFLPLPVYLLYVVYFVQSCLYSAIMCLFRVWQRRRKGCRKMLRGWRLKWKNCVFPMKWVLYWTKKWIIQKSYRLITVIHFLYFLLTLLPDCLSIGLLLLYQSLACTNLNGDHIYLHQSGTRWRPWTYVVADSLLCVFCVFLFHTA